jgi:Spy/CpxP family protein refolding chaperone
VKKNFVILLLFVLPVLKSGAQIRRETNPSQNIVSNTPKKNNGGQIFKDMDLTKEQKEQVKSLRLTMKQRRQDINNDKSLTEEQRQEKMKELQAEQRKKLSTILTPEQMKKLMDERRNRRSAQGKEN